MVLEIALGETVRSKATVFNSDEFIEVRRPGASDMKTSIVSSSHSLYGFRLKHHTDTNDATSILYFLILL